MAGEGGSQKTPALGLFSWCLYDWANSAFPTVITTFGFSAYFTEAIATDKITGTSQWGYAISLSGLSVALLSPLFGAVADHGGRRKPWLFLFTLLCIGASALLWLARPAAAYVIMALTLAALARANTGSSHLIGFRYENRIFESILLVNHLIGYQLIRRVL